MPGEAILLIFVVLILVFLLLISFILVDMTLVRPILVGEHTDPIVLVHVYQLLGSENLPIDHAQIQIEKEDRGVPAFADIVALYSAKVLLLLPEFVLTPVLLLQEGRED